MENQLVNTNKYVYTEICDTHYSVEEIRNKIIEKFTV